MVRIDLQNMSVLEECKHMLTYAIVEGNNYPVTVIL